MTGNVNKAVYKTYEDIPSGAPRNVRADVNKKRGVLVHWDPVDEDQVNGNIRDYVDYEISCELRSLDCAHSSTLFSLRLAQLSVVVLKIEEIAEFQASHQLFEVSRKSFAQQGKDLQGCVPRKVLFVRMT
ncbi:hypothetical protein KIN20_021628 [Parelaphostrongylus tenuis]|uniref:Fibronectin type-III domain-containing protein n=1 Tax=Parelaphostrongylus tenuis TaxID=148309 RepID=A0AAD5NB10_PARTN|nr:hypothetical protein KIN20_021628 [Parelaphostrongylus tenuis]